MRHSNRLAAIAATATLLCAGRARATWSVVGVDPVTREVGVAGASCIGGIERIIGLVPGTGALAAQAALSDSVRDVAIGYLAGGSSPQEVISQTMANTSGFNSRQYGVVDLMLRTAVFTGSGASAEKAGLEGMGVTAQGNLLTTTNVVSSSLAAFAAPPPATFSNTWSLADRLLVALEAGVPLGGDARCHPDRTALSAALRVARPTDTGASPYINLVVPLQTGSATQSGPNPVTKLRQMYDQWRMSNPRPPRPGSGDAGTGDGAAGASGAAGSGGNAGSGGGAGTTGTGGASGGSTGGTGNAGSAGAAAGSGGSGNAGGVGTGGGGGGGSIGTGGGIGGSGGTGGGPIGTGGAGTAGSANPSNPGDEGGCGCHIGRPSPSKDGWAALLALALLTHFTVRTRRRCAGCRPLEGTRRTW